MTESKVEIYGRWAEQLYQNGYDPLPLKGKKGMSGWTTFSMPDDEFERAEYIKKHQWLGYVGLIAILVIAIQLIIGGFVNLDVLSINEKYEFLFSI